MADTTIVNLPALAATPATDDLIEMVDISDTGNNATGENKKMTVAELVAAAGGGRVLLQTIPNVTAGEFDFGPALAGGIIPQEYNRLVIVGNIQGDAAIASDTVYLIMNGLTTAADYYHVRYLNNNGSPVDDAGSTPSIAQVTAASGSNSNSPVTIAIENYTSTTLLKVAQGRATYSESTTHRATAIQDSHHKTLVAPITRLQVRTNNHPTDQFIGTLRLYGEM